MKYSKFFYYCIIKAFCGWLCVSVSEKELTWGGRGEVDRVSGVV